MQIVRSFPMGHWSNGIYVLDDKEQQKHYTRILGAIVWPKTDQPGFVMAAGEAYDFDHLLGARPIQLLAEYQAENLVDFLNRISDLCRLVKVDRFFTPAEGIDRYLEFYLDTMRRAKLRSPNLVEAPFEGDVTLGYQLASAQLKKLIFTLPEEECKVGETIRTKSLDVRKLKTNIDSYPEIECLHYLVTGFAKFPWTGHKRRAPKSYVKPLDKVAGY